MMNNISFICVDLSTTIQNVFPQIYLAFMLTYLVGSLPFGLILTKIFLHKDIRKEGSGNIGTTNVLRTGNKQLAVSTLILDGAKAVVAVFLCTFFISQISMPLVIPTLIENYADQELIMYKACGLNPYYIVTPVLTMSLLFTAILGHCFPIWLKFKGGKGVATALGALLAAVPFAGLAAAAAWIATAFLFKISSLAALVAVGVAPIVTFFVYGAAPATVCLLITFLVWFRHKDNIKRLMAGTEPKIGAK